ncbi:MAG: single-stranded DNA-binding protein [Candidatus Thermoplasmatota archaeon]|nr:single-stranded DNA-binding protein [Candidatus Thermoplasmatota archaeon]MDI6887733.1 single-stranded DNA-binding protein [Candidatus Thermoplasmatota archaeon]
MRGEPTKIRDLTPDSKSVNVLAKVLEIGEKKEISSRFGGPRYVAEATVGDETATIILSLWNEQIGSIAPEDVIKIENGYVSLVRGHMRLNVGKYGKLSKCDEVIGKIDASTNISEREYEQAPRYGRWGRGRERRRF